jgi:hypothetical protein
MKVNTIYNNNYVQHLTIKLEIVKQVKNHILKLESNFYSGRKMYLERVLLAIFMRVSRLALLLIPSSSFFAEALRVRQQQI